MPDREQALGVRAEPRRLLRPGPDRLPEESNRARARLLKAYARDYRRSGDQYRAGDALNTAIGQGRSLVTLATGDGLRRHRERRDPGHPTSGHGLRERNHHRSAPRHGVRAPRDAGVRAQGPGDNDGDRDRQQGRSSIPPDQYPIAAKTGTAEVAGKQSTSWFASFAPADDPEYVVVVNVDQGAWGGHLRTRGQGRLRADVRDRRAMTTFVTSRPAVTIRRFDHWLLACAVSLSVIGVAMVYSTTWTRLVADGDPGGLRHPAGPVRGAGDDRGVDRLPARTPGADRAGRIGLWGQHPGTAGSAVPLGTTINGTRAWLTLPGGFTLQPAEFAKVFTVLLAALWLSDRQGARGLDDPPEARAVLGCWEQLAWYAPCCCCNPTSDRQ